MRGQPYNQFTEESFVVSKLTMHGLANPPTEKSGIVVNNDSFRDIYRDE